MNFLEDINEILDDILDIEEINDLKYLYDKKINIDSFFDKDETSQKEKELTPLEIAKTLKKKLPKYIYGQDHVIEKVVDYFKNNLVKMTGPKATFLFLGPPATGKTYMAEIMAKLLKGYKYKIFDMSQFIRDDSGISLYGSDFKYSNSTPGELTDFVLHNPKSIIVFDEIEKANNTIQNTLLSIYNTGKLKDKNGWIKEDDEYIPFNSNKSKNDIDYPGQPEIKEVDFSETILIFTSNAGKELYNSSHFWDIVQDNYSQAETMIIQALQKETKLSDGKEVPAITAPFLSRLSSGGLLLFKNLKFNQLLEIAKNAFNENIKLFNKEYNLKVKGLNNFVYSIFLLSFAPRVDIRRLKNKIAGDFFDLVTDYIVDNDIDIKQKRKIIIQIDEKAKKVFNEKIKPLIKEDIIKYMFRKNLTLHITKELKYEDNNFIYLIKDLELQKVQNVSDIGEDGIVFEVPDVSFKDIAGHKKAKQKLKEIINLLKKPKELKALGIDIPKGMLLYGPPGTGKTMLAKAVANEADLPFLATTGSDLFDLEKMDNIFNIAQDYAPSIIFIDEFDTIGSRAGSGSDMVINKLLAKLDGFGDDEDVFVIAATNYPDRIDSAIVRSGRIDIKIQIESLDKEARKYFIEKTLNLLQTKGEFDIDKLVLYTTGLNGSDLEKIKRECGLYMLKNGLKYLTQELLIEIINTIKYGEKIENIDISHTLESTAIHEAGHAVISKILKPEVKIEQITITPRDKALGFVSYSNEDNYKNMTKNDIKKDIQISLAGRYAQIKKYGEEGIDTGASSDLANATRLAYLAITSFGMDEKLKNLNISQIDGLENNLHLKDRIQAWLDEAEKNVKILIDENWDKIEKVANKLLEEESIDEKEMMEIIG